MRVYPDAKALLDASQHLRWTLLTAWVYNYCVILQAFAVLQSLDRLKENFFAAAPRITLRMEKAYYLAFVSERFGDLNDALNFFSRATLTLLDQSKFEAGRWARYENYDHEKGTRY